MNKGIVKFFNSGKGYGFITNDKTEKDIFVHMSALNNDLKELQEGQIVTYDIEKDPKSNKDRATNVTVI